MLRRLIPDHGFDESIHDIQPGGAGGAHKSLSVDGCFMLIIVQSRREQHEKNGVKDANGSPGVSSFLIAFPV